MKRKREPGLKIIKLVEGLPLFPHDVDGLLAAALKPSEDSAKILELMEKEPEVREELLELARSYYAAGAEVGTTEEAVERFGAQSLVQLIGLLYARRAIQEEFASLRYLNEYFDHSESISIGCHILAEHTGASREQVQLYTVSGLIHDIGRLAIMVARNRTSAHVLGTLWDKMASVVYDEEASVGTNHCKVGMRICRKWKFSPIIQEGVLRHHSPLVDSDFSVPGAIIFVSHFLSASDPSGDIVSSLSAGEVLGRLGLTRGDFDKSRCIYKTRTQETG
ncbi:MAG: HDOD domain-containing protein [Planctomycetota bacterium]|nr:MAG: HDOD domain-containing protein [Planctomycetota bacterium]